MSFKSDQADFLTILFYCVIKTKPVSTYTWLVSCCRLYRN